MKVGHEIETARAKWSFDGSVADTFVDHVRQSVPLYDAGHELITSISDYFVRDDSTCYEIGTSTGQLLRRLAEHHGHKPGVRWIGIDAVAPMVAKARVHCADLPNVAVVEDDALLPLIIMKAMNSVTAVIKLTDRGGKPLWNTSHWTYTRSTPGHE